METLLTLVTALPWVLLWLVAGVLAAVWWTRHPLVSALVITACVIHVLTAIAGRMLPVVLHERGESMASVGLVSSGIGLVGLVGSTCLVAAVFVGRQGSASGAVTPRSE